MAYRLRGKDFYLPYLALVSERGLEKPDRVDKFGSHAIGELQFTSDELAAVADAAIRVRQLGEPDLAANATSAMRKLAQALVQRCARDADDPCHGES